MHIQACICTQHAAVAFAQPVAHHCSSSSSSSSDPYLTRIDIPRPHGPGAPLLCKLVSTAACTLLKLAVSGSCPKACNLNAGGVQVRSLVRAGLDVRKITGDDISQADYEAAHSKVQRCVLQLYLGGVSPCRAHGLSDA